MTPDQKMIVAALIGVTLAFMWDFATRKDL